MDLGLNGRKAIVTGGSKGLGREIADELAREGCHVAICARSANEVAVAGQELRTHGGHVFSRTCDVTDANQVKGFFADAADMLGGVDILVNNAGRAHPGTFETLTDEDWRDDLDVKLFSMIRCSRAALPHLRQSEAARIINVNAIQAKSPDPEFFATSTDRAACLAFNKTLSLELAKDGILVNAINVGYVVTPQWKYIHQKREPELPESEFFASLAEAEVPLGRMGQPEEVSAATLFLASARASYITGTSIDVAGGMGRFL